MSNIAATEPTPSAPLNFTLAAASKVHQLIEEEGNPKLNLRVYIVGGGCSGFQYGFTFDEAINVDDTVITKALTEADNSDASDDDEGGSGRVNLLVDPMSFQYLVGADIDYTEGIEGAQFVIRNPNAQTTCGCGSSFSV